MSHKKQTDLVLCIAAVLLAAASSLYIFIGSPSLSLPQLLLADLYILVVSAVIVMAFVLKKSLSATLYAYKNIGLIAAMLFLAVLAGMLIVYFINCLFSGDMSVGFLYKHIVAFPRRFSYYAVFIIVAMCLLIGISNIVLIRKEGFCLNNALSIIMAGFYIGGTAIIYVAVDLLAKRVFVSRSPAVLVLGTAIPLFMILVLCYFECVFAGTVIMGYKAAKHIPAYNKDFIIVLGCSIDKKGGLLPLLKGRVNRAVRFAWEQEIATGKPVKYVPSGGQGPNEVMSEGSAMGLYLLAKGAEESEVFPEKKSTDTYENMLMSKKIIDSINPNATIAFATTNYHILRSGIIARKAGFDAEGVAGDTKWYFWPNGFVREFFGILAMKIKSHITVAVILAVLCTCVALAGYYIGAL